MRLQHCDQVAIPNLHAMLNMLLCWRIALLLTWYITGCFAIYLLLTFTHFIFNSIFEFELIDKQQTAGVCDKHMGRNMIG